MPAFMKSPNKCPGSSCEGCASANCYAVGGMTHAKGALENKGRYENEKGVHKTTYSGRSYAGNMVDAAHKKNSSIPKEELNEEAKQAHKEKLSELKSMPKPKLMAEGGAVSEDDTLGKKIGYPKNMAEGGEMDADGDHDGDEELHHAIGGELMDALERKDKKGIMSALEAAIMQCMGKE